MTIGSVKFPVNIFKPPLLGRGALLLGVVLLVHWLALAYLRDQLGAGTALKPMPSPIFMRLLKPVAVVPPPPPKRRKPVRSAHPAAPPPVVAAATVPEPVPEPVLEAALPQASDGPVAAADGPAADATEPPDTPDEAPSSSWPADTRLSYTLKGFYRGDFSGDGQVQWQRMDTRYQVQVNLHIASLFTGTMISQGVLTEAGLQPQVYEERWLNRVRRLTFDGLGVTFTDGRVFPQPQGVQDTSSQFVELSHRFSTGQQSLVVGSQVALWLARPREMRFWTYDVVALETLQIPEFGDVAAYHLVPRQIANPTGVVTAELWFAPSLQFLPVRIRINLGNNNYMDWLVNRIEQGQTPPDPVLP